MGLENGQRGLIYNTFCDIFDRLAKLPSNDITHKVKVTFIEVYGNDLYDLFDKNPVKVPITSPIIEDKNHFMQLRGLTEHIVTNLDQAVKLTQNGISKRVTYSHQLNAYSSRSHAIFNIYLESTTTWQTKLAKLTLIDLAGSERVKRTKSLGKNFREGIYINQSLLALAKVIKLKSSNQNNVHVPYRSSKLTRLLQDTLDGRSKLSFIACIDCRIDNLGESLNTFRYANQMRNIKCDDLKSRAVIIDTAEINRCENGAKTKFAL
ncbi:uncharacterized protein LOC142598018 [Dermatophagoides farinae]|uniref:uncharacterized protein LOC142598018 n=1 Tax=Dermatophagoides farinae TaxID=6954 RepID=UPI003F5F6887